MNSRQKQLGKLTRFLKKYSEPRFQLFLILVLTGSVGAAVSFVLLNSGLHRMWLRYPLAAIGAYLSFLALLRLWAQYQLSRPHLPLEQGDAEPETEPAPPLKKKESFWRADCLDVLDVAAAFDDLPVAILVLALVIVLVIAVGIIVAAPVLFAELLLDGLLVAGLWRRFTNHGTGSSLGSAVRGTVLPATIVVACLGVMGFMLQLIEPGADSIGDIFQDRD